MAFAQGSRSSLAYITETAFGTTPSTPTLATLPINSHSLDLTKDRVEGNQINADRMPRVDRHGNVTQQKTLVSIACLLALQHPQ